MIKELFYKWFGLEPFPCTSCEILRSALEESNRERRELLKRLLEPPEPSSPPVNEKDLTPITPKFVPWRIRQQMFEEEDRKAAQLIRDKQKEMADIKPQIEELEKELEIHQEVKNAAQ